MRARIALAAAGALASSAVLLTTATASPAGALDPSTPQTVVVGGPSGVVLPLQVDRLYPGIGTHARFVVRRGSTWSAGTFAVTVTDVEDLERGCNRPEQNAGDATCGAGSDQGELSDQLLVNALWTSDVPSCATAPVPAGLARMRLARDVPFLAPVGLSTGDVCLVVALQLPISADNLVQSDLVRFSLRIGLDGAALAGVAGEPVAVRTPDAPPTTPAAASTPSSSPAGSPTASASPVAGIVEEPAQVTPTGPPGTEAPTAAPATSRAPTAALAPQPRALPFTGGQPLLLLGWGALLVFAGHVLVRTTRQRRRLT